MYGISVVTKCRQIECDCKFLESQHIMDYSFLLGVHFRAPQFPSIVCRQDGMYVCMYVCKFACNLSHYYY